jgi:hypothetical protein
MCVLAAVTAAASSVELFAAGLGSALTFYSIYKSGKKK